MRRNLLIAASVIFGIIALAAIVLVVLSNTNFGRERVRRIALNALRDRADGIVRIGRVSGNLFTGVKLDDVSITDSAGLPFLKADRITTRYDLAAALRERIILSDVHLLRPVIVLSKATGGKWNFRRIFPRDTTPDPDTTSGFGDWVAFRNLSMEDGRVTLRLPWTPKGDLSYAERDSAVAAALGANGRSRIERAPTAEGDGYQRVLHFSSIHARLPLFRLKDADSAGMAAEIAALRMSAAPFRGPVADVRGLSGRLTVAHDTLSFRDARVAFPGSRVTGAYVMALKTKDVDLRLNARPIALSDLRWLYTRLPEDGGGPADFTMIFRGDTRDFTVNNADITRGETRIQGDFGILLGDSTTLHDTGLRFSGVDTRWIEQLVPKLDLPRQGILAGNARLAGTTRAIRTSADITFDDVRSGWSHAVLDGTLGVAGGFTARDLRVRAMPAQVDLARIFVRDLPIGGTVTGVATINGSASTRLALTRLNVVHRDRGETSRVTGRATIIRGARPGLDVDVHVSPLSLVTVGRFVPKAGLTGAATGDVVLRGELGNLALRADLELAGDNGRGDNGRIVADGTLDVASSEIGYDLNASASALDLKRVMLRSPSTMLNARAEARGRGFDPATMTASLFADIAPSEVDSVQVDSVAVRVAIADGLAKIDSLSLRTSFARADLGGAVGLTDARSGELTYRVQIDSLAGLERWIPGDTGMVRARPARVAGIMARARADSAEIAKATEIEREVTGEPAPPALVVDTTGMGIPRDSLSGSLAASGTLTGSITRFNLRGKADLKEVVARGNSVRGGQVEYEWTDARTPAFSIKIGARLDTILAAGFELHRVDGRLSYRKPSGHLELAIVQDTGLEYRANADFALHLDHREVHFTDLRLRFDTTTWASTRPGTVRWGKRGIEVETFELRGSGNRRIYVNGLLPTEGVADLDVAVEGLQIAHVVALLQGDLQAQGIVSLDTHVEGTQTNPRFSGTGSVTAGSFRGKTVPDARATFQYADERLTAHAELLRGDSAVMAVAEGSLPVNLALAGVTGPRLLNETLTIDIRADSLALEMLPDLADAITDVSGRASGSITVRGTVRQPALSGALFIDRGSLRIVRTGVVLRNIAGSVRMSGDTITIDSLAGTSGGPVRVKGQIHLATFSEPGFDLELTATNAVILDTETQGRLRADGAIEIKGPYESVRISGRTTVRNGVFYIPEAERGKVISTGDPAVFSVLDTSVVADRELLPNQSSLLKNIIIDVELRVRRDTWVRSTEANVEIFTPEDRPLLIDVDRRQNALRVEGAVNTERGEYEFYGRRFKLTRGSATFLGGTELNPLLQLVGEHEVQIPGREVLQIRVIIAGTLRNPRLALESNAQPPIAQSDLLSYLAFGQSSSSLLQFQGSGLSGQGSGSGKLGGQVAALATRQLASIALNQVVKEAERDLARSLGADVLNIAPADLPPELSTTGVETVLRGTEVEAGKYVNTRTFVAVQARPTTETWPGIRLEHRMAKGFRIETGVESRFLLRQPSLSAGQQPTPVNVFGLFLVREWRF